MIKKIRAFSLIEMLIVIAIIAILAVLGIVWYQDAVIRTNRSRGISLMQEEAVRRQQRFILTGTYGNDAAGAVINRGAYGDLGGIFQLSITPTATAFTLSLTANSTTNLSQRVRNARCFEIRLDQTGLQQVIETNGGVAVGLDTEARRACWR
jgi:type IV pilus assembly protein PilE